MLIPPVITLGGTSPERLLLQANEVRHHLQATLDAMREAAPNARDYPSDFTNATEAYKAHVRDIELILQDFDALAEHAVGAIR